MDKITETYITWLRQVDAQLSINYGIKSEHAWHGDWHFDFWASWVAGVTPNEAMQDAIAELRDRGILDEAMAYAGAEAEREAL